MNWKQSLNLLQNMGWRYLRFRVGFELKKKAGLLQKQYPTNPEQKSFITLEGWKKLDTQFFFNSRADLRVPINKEEKLKAEAEQILKGSYRFFNAMEYNLGNNYDWVTNPDTGYQYNKNTHWLYINDYSKEAGDIKYVWEKSRFTYLNTLIRYDYHFGVDLSEKVIGDILDWIDNNPINCGPNYKCSQETSLRLMNWTYALYYYKDSSSFPEEAFQKIMHALYWQTEHVYSNIDFSRIAVRNNHAITETLWLYLSGILYPFLPNAKKRRHKGKKWFEEEIAYQIYEDGTFLQFSMNYHRVVIQLLTWAIQLNKKNDKPFKQVVYDRAKQSLKFLEACMNQENGMLPNYGANDGALFFKWNDQEFRDYRPALEALNQVLEGGVTYGDYEDKYWFGITEQSAPKQEETSTLSSFTKGGYYLIIDEDSLTFLRCGNHKDRPSQADNLHFDLWVDGVNLLRDAGSYKYNTDEDTIRYFFGTAGHNTVMLNGYDQMLKGARFIWYYWSQSAGASIKETDNNYIFEGTIKAFQQVDKSIRHTRRISKQKGLHSWKVVDELAHNTGESINQIWNPSPEFLRDYTIVATDENGNQIPPIMGKGWYAHLYGKKEETTTITFTTKGKYIKTIIEKKA